MAEANQMAPSLLLGLMRTNDTMGISGPFLFSHEETLPVPIPWQRDQYRKHLNAHVKNIYGVNSDTSKHSVKLL